MTRAIDAPPPDFRVLRLSSDLLPEQDRFETWRDLVTRKMLRLSIDRLTEAPFKADALLRSQHGLTIGVGDIGPSINRRTREIVAGDNDDFVLMANLAGPFVVNGPKAELTLEAGDAVLMSCAETGSYIRPSSGRLLCARLPRSALASLVLDPDEHTGRLIPRQNGPLGLLIAYASALWDYEHQTIIDPKASRFVVDHLCDLVALTVGATGDAAEFAAARSVRAAKLKAVKSAIEARLGPIEFSVDDVAAEVGVSPRYVRKLLESEGVSFSRYVAERRLERARSMISSSRHANLTISAIAYEVGFGDLSYFNRAFRRLYGQTPSDVRAQSK